jgi:ubiquinone/menaquinone biosynthesis C-methylase UbiE
MNVIETIPSSNTDRLLRERRFDLLGEYLQVVNEADLVPDVIVEMATGTGRTAAILARLGFRVITGDITLEKRSEALQRITPGYCQQVSMIVLNMERLPFRDNSIRNIISLNTVHELDRPHTCITELIRVHQPDGRLIIGDFNDTGFALMQEIHRIAYGRDHSRGHLSAESVQEMLSSSYESVRAIETPLNVSFLCAGKLPPVA